MSSENNERIEIFEPSIETKRQMSERLSELLAEQQKIAIRDYISPDNHLAYRHGETWNHPANDFSQTGKMETVHAEYSIPFERIIDADMSLLTESVSSISEQMKKAFVQGMYQTINEACDRSGNVVSGMNLPDSFLEALEKVDFSVDPNGNVEFPQFHVGSAEHLRILQGQPEEFVARVEAIKKRKSEQALVQELQRKSRYKSQV